MVCFPSTMHTRTVIVTDPKRCIAFPACDVIDCTCRCIHFGMQAHPDDCERIARVHVRKQTNFTAPFYGSIISTTDNDSWRHQRAEFTQAFLPVASLSKVFPVSLNRSRKCSQILQAELQDAQEGVVDMNNFLLHETQAQLQLAMFGETEDFMNKTNDNFRSGMST